MKYFLSMLAVLALVGGGCVGPVETDSDDAATDNGVGIELEDSDDSEDSDDDDANEATIAQEIPVVTPEQEQAMDTTTDTAVEEPTTEGTTIDLQGGGELTYTETEEGDDEVSEDDGVQITDIVLGGAADLNIDMVSGNFFFEPNTITASPGESIRIEFTENSGFHTFVIDELDLSFSITEGEGLKFTAPTEPGSYAFYCDIGSHRAFGMEGTLIVQ